MNKRPPDEPEKVWFRSKRYFCVDSKWYFTTREGENVGPFPSVQAASDGLQLYMDCLKVRGTTPEQAAKVAASGHWQTHHWS